MNSKTTKKQPSATAQRQAKKQQDSGTQMHWSREGIESIVIAVILALLFRTFEAEAFVIPTGSMAPTLQGRHKDMTCAQCGYSYRTGAALLQEQGRFGPVVETNCPMCRYGQRIDPSKRNQDSFSGDRILVNKFAYQFGEPQRWDVIVFKFPGNAKQNYIKRLVGLPGETLRVQHGDVFVRPSGENEFQIARKPPNKLEAMLQLVSDTSRIPESMVKTDWPESWSDLAGSGNWTISEDRQQYVLNGSDSESWLRYRHIVPRRDDWFYIRNANRPPDVDRKQGGLITDYYAYNDFLQFGQDPLSVRNPNEAKRFESNARLLQLARSGMNWVGDLALECHANVSSNAGALLLDLVEAGVHYTCRIDLATGEAQLSIDGDAQFAPVDGTSPTKLIATTKVKGAGKYRLRFANVDDQLLLWVGRMLVSWNADGKPHPGHTTTAQSKPRWSSEDPGDLAPVGIGGEGIEMTVNQLRVLRDIYYVADKSQMGVIRQETSDYSVPVGARDVVRIFTDPSVWATTNLFDKRQTQEFELNKFPDQPGRDQFFPMGDNNPQSKDARLWTSGNEPSAYSGKLVEIDHYVERELLIGKAFLVYWPHGWNVANMRIPIVPNIRRMGRIR